MTYVIEKPTILLPLDELDAMLELPADQLKEHLLSLQSEQQEKRKREKREREKDQKRKREESKREEKDTLGSRGVRGEETPLDVKFAAFWKAYPKKKQKSVALKSFSKLNPDDALLDLMLSAIASQKKSRQWTSNNGQYIPYPSTWLNQRRWEDEDDLFHQQLPMTTRNAEAEIQAWVDHGETLETARRYVNDGFYITD